MHKLVNPAAATAAALPGDDGSSAGGAGVAAAGGGLGKGGLAGGVNVEWQGAAGRLAAVTPLLVVGTDSYHEADMVERLKVNSRGVWFLCKVSAGFELNVRRDVWVVVGGCWLPIISASAGMHDVVCWCKQACGALVLKKLQWL